MRSACQGTLTAARAALADGFAVNLSGGYHHAKPDDGEGFCVFADVSYALKSLWQDNTLADDALVLYIDLDAHMGNGVAHCFLEDPRVRLFDMYNNEIYPYDPEAAQRIDCNLPLKIGCEEDLYLGILADNLPSYVDQLTQEKPIALAVYNAGTDPYEGDELGGMKISQDGILRRDVFVFQTLQSRNIPTLFVPSGGYSKLSYQLIATSVDAMLSGS